MDVKTVVNKVRNRYNPEFDLIPDGPRVTWAEMELAEAVEALLKKVEELEKRISELEA